MTNVQGLHPSPAFGTVDPYSDASLSEEDADFQELPTETTFGRSRPSDPNEFGPNPGGVPLYDSGAVIYADGDTIPHTYSTLYADPGIWTNSPTFYTYHWYVNGASTGETNSFIYLPNIGAQLGDVVRCVIRAYNAIGGGYSHLSNLLTLVGAGAAPVNVTPPVLTGGGGVGTTITVGHSGWINGPTSYTHKWYRSTFAPSRVALKPAQLENWNQEQGFMGNTTFQTYGIRHIGFTVPIGENPGKWTSNDIPLTGVGDYLYVTGDLYQNHTAFGNALVMCFQYDVNAVQLAVSPLSTFDVTHTGYFTIVPSYMLIEPTCSFVVLQLVNAGGASFSAIQDVRVRDLALYRSEPAGGATLIVGQTNQTYVTELWDVGWKIYAEVQATNAFGSSGYVASNETAGAVAAGGTAYVPDENSDAIAVVDLATNTVTSTIVSGLVPYWNSMQVTPNKAKTYLYADTGDGTSVLVRFNPLTQAFGSPITTLNSSIYGWAFSPNSYKAFSGSYNAQISQVSLIDDTIEHTYTIANLQGVFSKCISPDSTKMYVTTATGSTYRLRAIDVGAQTVGSPITLAFYCNGPGVFSPDGTKFYLVAPNNGRIIVIDTGTDTVTTTIDTRDNGADGIFPDDCIAVSPDGSKIYVARALLNAGAACEICVIDIATDTMIEQHIPWTDFPTQFVFDPTGAYMTSDNINSAQINLLDLSDNTVIPITTTYPAGEPYFSSDRLVLADGNDNLLVVIDTRTFAEVADVAVTGGGYATDVVISSAGSGIDPVFVGNVSGSYFLNEIADDGSFVLNDTLSDGVLADGTFVTYGDYVNGLTGLVSGQNKVIVEDYTTGPPDSLVKLFNPDGSVYDDTIGDTFLTSDYYGWNASAHGSTQWVNKPFEHTGGTARKMWNVGNDGSTLILQTAPPGNHWENSVPYERAGALAPDGTWGLFNRVGFISSWLYDNIGSAVINVTADLGNSPISYAPDSSALILWQQKSGNLQDLEVCLKNGTRTVILSNAPITYGYPVAAGWSADSTQVVFIDSATLNVRRCNKDGTGMVTLFNPTGSDQTLAFAIVYQDYLTVSETDVICFVLRPPEAGRGKAITMNIDGTGYREHYVDGTVTSAMISKDGSRIWFTEDVNASTTNYYYQLL